PEKRDRITDQHGPQKVLRVLQIPVQPRRPGLPRSHLLRDPPAPQREKPRLHSRAQERNRQARRQHNQQQRFHQRTSASSSRTRRSPPSRAVTRTPRNVPAPPSPGTYPNCRTSNPPTVSTSSTSGSAGYSRRNSSSVQPPLNLHFPGRTRSSTVP